MAVTWSCPQEHRWDDDLRNMDDLPPRCPRCGEPGLRVLEAIHSTAGAPPYRPPLSLAVTIASPEPGTAEAQKLRDRLAGFEILGRLGEGGMGTVFKARHLRLNRLVAVKIIRGASTSPKLRARFQVEAETLASLSHPNIVQIFEIGEFDEQPFIALEFVEGGSLRTRLDFAPMAPRDGAKLIATIARAIHAAHLRGVIHRDLKPDNILLAADGSPKITDFGVAKRLVEGQEQTQVGIAVGTPAYMAPEQAAAESHLLSPLIDVYALGVILYEILSGDVPFRASTAPALLRKVQNDAPPPPLRKGGSPPPRDLEVICLKCLEKNPARRYASAAALADDLDRFLNHEPIEARPISRWRRAGLWLRRHPTTSALGAASIVFGIVLLSLGIWSYRNLKESSERAERRLNLAQAILDDMYAKVTEQWIADEPRRDPVQQEFLDKACQFYEAIVAEKGNDPVLLRSQALAQYRLADIHHKLGKADLARQQIDRAIAMQSDLSRTNPNDPRLLEDLAKSRAKRGELLWENRSDLALSADDWKAALDGYQALSRFDPSRDELHGSIGKAHYNLALLAEDARRIDDAKAEVDHAIELLEPLTKVYPSDVNFRHDLARAHINRGVLFKRQEPPNFRDAEREYRRAIELLNPRVGEPINPALIVDREVARQNLGNLFLSQKNSQAASAVLNDACKDLEKLVQEYPNRRGYQKKLAAFYNSLATVYVQDGHREQAEKLWQRGRELAAKLVEEQPDVPAYRHQLGLVLGNLGWSASTRDELEVATALIEKAIDHLEAALKKNDRDSEVRRATANQYQTLAEIQLKRKAPLAAADAAQKMAETIGDGAQEWYYAACFQSRAVGLLKDKASANAIVAQCRNSLSRAGGDGTASISRLADEADIFRPVASDLECQKLLAALSK